MTAAIWVAFWRMASAAVGASTLTPRLRLARSGEIFTSPMADRLRVVAANSAPGSPELVWAKAGDEASNRAAGKMAAKADFMGWLLRLATAGQ